MRRLQWLMGVLVLVTGSVALAKPPAAVAVAERHGAPNPKAIVEAFGKQGIRINFAEARGIRQDVAQALREASEHGIGNSKVDFAAVEIAQALGLDTSKGSNTVKNIVGAIRYLHRRGRAVAPPPPPPKPPLAWNRYFNETLSLWRQPRFISLLRDKGFYPVKISWEDIGRYQGSVSGDRISDVGIWVRRDEADPQSAGLALSVRRDSNFRDKVLVVPAKRIKVHLRSHGKTVERTLPQRLRELGLTSRTKDRNVIVSNQFAIVPVPAADMQGAWRPGHPPRAAFTFSIFPYGSTNFVITDVIEGSHDAIVGPGTHQLLFANVHGRRAPFTASRAKDRPDLLRLERQLKAQGMDVDVQRYYLIQIPLRKNASGVQLSNMETPPVGRRGYGGGPLAVGSASGGGGQPKGGIGMKPSAKAAAAPQMSAEAAAPEKRSRRPDKDEGLAKVAIGTGKTEGAYRTGAGWRGQRAEEPIRVTVVYFVTPVGQVTAADMKRFAKAFSTWDKQAIWGGSFVTKESW